MLKIIRKFFSLDNSETPSHGNYIKQGNQWLSNGNLEAAAKCYESSILENPNQAEAYVNLGFVLSEQQQYEVAINNLEKALAINPKTEDALYLLAIIAQKQANPEKAIGFFTRTIEVNPFFELAYQYLYPLLMNNKDAIQAERILSLGIEHNPNSSGLHYLLGEQYANKTDWISAEEHFKKSLSLNPDQAITYCRLGDILQHQKKFDQAIEFYKKAVFLEPRLTEAYNNLGSLLTLLKSFDEAADCFKKAIDMNPENDVLHFNLGVVLMDQKYFNEAIVHYKNSIALNPDFFEAYNNLGVIYLETNQFEQALENLDKAISLNPTYVEAHVNRGISLQMLRRIEEAITSFEKALSIKLDFDYLIGKLLHAKMRLSDWSNFDNAISELIQQIHQGKKASSGFPLFFLVTSPAIHRKAAEIWLQDKYPPNSILGNISKYPRSPKIRLGYFSADFNFHPVSILLAELFELHNKNNFELIAFSFGSGVKDAMTERIQRAFDQFIDVRHQSDKAVALLARQMKVDVAIDLGGDTTNSRPGIFSYRAAPIQINYLGYPGTMGADYFDYLIADKTIIPQNTQQHYVEKIMYLPTYLPSDSTRHISEKVFTRLEFGLPPEGFVFCCFNDNYKITPAIWNSWLRILKAVSDSVLFLYADNELTRKNMREKAKAEGIDSTRVIFANRLENRSDYLARYKTVDLFLDTFPYNAHATANDALWAELPLLTLTGESFPSRVAASLLNAIDLPELITDTLENYETLAIELATNPEKLNAIKTKLVANKLTTQIFNAKLYTKHIETAYTQAVERYQSDLPPDHIYV